MTQEYNNIYQASINHIKAIEEKLKELTIQFETQKVKTEINLLDNSDIKKIFNITDRTVSTWSSNGILSPLKVAGKIYYDVKDINQMLEKAKNPLKKKE